MIKQNKLYLPELKNYNVRFGIRACLAWLKCYIIYAPVIILKVH